ncbi:MAG: GntR family transcriptional regulator [Burkholderiales bacterium]|nr:GntR family transcriptional regulator [Burkholderiales bacterium]
MPVVRSPTFSPLYQQIKALIMQSLGQGEWKPGELIPSEVELSLRFGVSQGTVRKAIDELSNENLLVRRQGKGTFVATHNEARAHFRFLRLVPDTGEPKYPESRIVEFKRLRLPADITRLLELKAGESGFVISRVLSFNAKPTVLDEIWLPLGPFKGLSIEQLNAWSGPLYGFFESTFDVCMVSAEERIKAVSADKTQADLLGVDQGFPLLYVERLSRAFGDKPVEVRRGWYVTDNFYYKNELS